MSTVDPIANITHIERTQEQCTNPPIYVGPTTAVRTVNFSFDFPYDAHDVQMFSDAIRNHRTPPISLDAPSLALGECSWGQFWRISYLATFSVEEIVDIVREAISGVVQPARWEIYRGIFFRD